MSKIRSLFLLVLVAFLGVGCQGGGNNTSSAASSGSIGNNSSAAPVELSLELTENFKLQKSYSGKSFLSDGIGLATLVRTVDGDTAHFRVSDSTEIIKIRFDSVDTPESTFRIDPWGKAASKQMSNWLNAAEVIVMETNEEDMPAQLDNTGGRYLGFVWVSFVASPSLSDFFLTNLGMVELAYSIDKSSNKRYTDIFTDAARKAYQSGRRIYGERDPDYDYNKNFLEVTPYQLLEDKKLPEEEQQYSGKRVVVTGWVTRKVGASFYLYNYAGQSEDDDDYDPSLEDEVFAIYVYGGFESTDYITAGMFVQVRGNWSDSGEYGFQLVVGGIENHLWLFTENKDTSTINVVPIESTSVSAVNERNYGLLVQLNNVKIVSFYPTAPVAIKGGLSVTVQDASGARITVRVDTSVNEIAVVINQASFGAVNDYISVRGPVAYYNGGYQLMMCLSSDIIK